MLYENAAEDDSRATESILAENAKTGSEINDPARGKITDKGQQQLGKHGGYGSAVLMQK